MTDEWIAITIVLTGICSVIGIFIGGELALWMDRRGTDRDRRRRGQS